MNASFRRRYFVFFVSTVAAGLAIHLHGGGLAARTRDVLGDALWAAMIVWLVSFTAPRVRLAWRAIAALAICLAVELSQMIEHPVLQAARSSPIGHLFLGSDFDVRDLAAYSGGVAAAVLLDLAAAWSARVRWRSAEGG